MLDMREKDDAEFAGCLMAFLVIMIQFPLFCVLLYGILDACQPQSWVWVVFWIYFPVGLIFAMARTAVEQMAKH